MSQIKFAFDVFGMKSTFTAEKIDQENITIELTSPIFSQKKTFKKDHAKETIKKISLWIDE